MWAPSLPARPAWECGGSSCRPPPRLHAAITPPAKMVTADCPTRSLSPALPTHSPASLSAGTRPKMKKHHSDTALPYHSHPRCPHLPTSLSAGTRLKMRKHHSVAALPYHPHPRCPHLPASLSAGTRLEMREHRSVAAPSDRRRSDPWEVARGEVQLPRSGVRSPSGKWLAALHVYCHPRCPHSPTSLSAEFGEKVNPFADFERCKGKSENGNSKLAVRNSKITRCPDDPMTRSGDGSITPRYFSS